MSVMITNVPFLFPMPPMSVSLNIVQPFFRSPVVCLQEPTKVKYALLESPEYIFVKNDKLSSILAISETD